MPVRILNWTDKLVIKTNYTTKAMNQKQLATNLGVSERTINRVLIELELSPPVARLHDEAYQVMQLLKKHNLTIPQLSSLLSTKTKQGNAHAAS